MPSDQRQISLQDPHPWQVRCVLHSKPLAIQPTQPPPPPRRHISICCHVLLVLLPAVDDAAQQKDAAATAAADQPAPSLRPLMAQYYSE